MMRLYISMFTFDHEWKEEKKAKHWLACLSLFRDSEWRNEVEYENASFRGRKGVSEDVPSQDQD